MGILVSTLNVSKSLLVKMQDLWQFYLKNAYLIDQGLGEASSEVERITRQIATVQLHSGSQRRKDRKKSHFRLFFKSLPIPHKYAHHISNSERLKSWKNKRIPFSEQNLANLFGKTSFWFSHSSFLVNLQSKSTITLFWYNFEISPENILEETGF